MSRNSRDFKPTQVFDWESEPADERPTDFGRSTGFSSLSGYGALPNPRPQTRRHRGHGEGMFKLALSAVFLLGLCSVALYKMAHLLHA